MKSCLASRTIVPGGTSSTRFSAEAPWRLFGPPGSPSLAFHCLRCDKRQQAIDIFLREDDDAAAVAAVAAVGAAVLDVFLPAEADQPVAAVARLDFDFHFIQKQHKLSLP